MRGLGGTGVGGPACSASSESIPVMSSMSGGWYCISLGASTIRLALAWVHAPAVHTTPTSALARATVSSKARFRMA